MAAYVEPCYCTSQLVPHEYERGCPGHPHSALSPAAADLLRRVNEGDPTAAEEFNALAGSDPLPEPEPILSLEESRELNRRLEEMGRVRAQGAARGAGYWIGGGC